MTFRKTVQNEVPFWSFWSYHWRRIIIWWRRITWSDKNVWIFWKYLILVLIVIFLDTALVYKISKFANCVNRHLFKPYWSNMALIQVSHPHVILFMLLIDFICFWYILFKCITTNTHYTILVSSKINSLWDTDKIRSFCISSTEVWSLW